MKYKYDIIVSWSNENKSFIAKVPELAGCIADGETNKRALENVQVIFGEWIETARLKNKTMPQSKGSNDHKVEKSI